MNELQKTAAHEAAHAIVGAALGAVLLDIRIDDAGGRVRWREMPADPRAVRCIQAAGAIGEHLLQVGEMLWNLDGHRAWVGDAGKINAAIASRHAPGSRDFRMAWALTMSATQGIVIEHRAVIEKLARLLEETRFIDCERLCLRVPRFPISSLPDDPEIIDVRQCERLLADFQKRSAAWHRSMRPERHNPQMRMQEIVQ